MTPDLPPSEYLMYVLGGKSRAQAVSTAAAWRLADRLAAGPRTAASLAAEVGCDAGALESVLRVCTGLGFFATAEPGEFVVTERGRTLAAAKLGPLAEFVGGSEQWDPWSRLRDVRDGDVAFDLAHRAGLYDWLARHPEAAARYDAAIDAFTRHEAGALRAAYDFATAQRVVDVGGGRGTLLAEVLDGWPHLHGVLVDLPHVVERAAPELRRAFGARVSVHGGDFFGELPRGADVYLIKRVLHNWNDDRARELLARCAAALAPGGRILAIEAVLSPDQRADQAAIMDLEMRVLLGGRVRRKPELRRLFAEAGLTIERFEPLSGGSWLVVGARA